MRRKVIKQLELLQGINPRTEWVDKTREVLLAQVTAQGVGPNRPSKLTGAWVYTQAGLSEVYRMSLGPLVAHSTATAVLLLSLVSGGATAHFASQDALPGDNLYAIKKTGEEIRAAIASSADQAALRVEFSENRLAELEELTKRSDMSESGTMAIAQLVDEVQQNLSAAKNHIALRQDPTANSAVKVASLVGEQAEKYEAVLGQLQGEQGVQAIAVVGETAKVALERAIEQEKTEDEATVVAATLGAQVKQAQQKVEQVQTKVSETVAGGAEDSAVTEGAKAAQEQSQEAKKMLKDAEVSLAKKDFKLAFEQLTQSKELLANAERSLKKKGDINTGTSPDATKKVLQ